MTTPKVMPPILQEAFWSVGFWKLFQLVFNSFSFILPFSCSGGTKFIIGIQNSSKENPFSFLIPFYLSHGNIL